MTPDPVRIGLLTSVGRTLDCFFPPIVDRWRSRGLSVSLASGGSSELPSWTRIAGLDQRPSPSSAAAFGALRRWVADQRLDVVVTNTATASAAVRAARLPVPVVYFCHGLHWQDGSSPRSWPWQLIESVLLRRTAGVLTLNGDDEAWFRRRTTRPVQRLPVGIGVPLPDYPASAVPGGPLVLLWAGDFSPRKRPELAVAVIGELVRQRVPVRLRMLGDGPLHEAVRQQIRAEGLGAHVEAEGRGAVAPALTSASALLHTSSWEGLPRVALEAAAVGRWCYGFDVKGLRDAPTVRLVDDGDVPALARRIRADVESGAVREVPDVRGRLDVTAAADRAADFVLAVLGRPDTPVPAAGAQAGARQGGK